MDHQKRRATIGGADASRITEDPTPLVRERGSRQLAEEGEVA